ncbi:hypothetical protein PZB74_15230 [Porifericola rhodea]|uniref:hypothetical protein n=1 Tax=Porifericola rhodea TaxID=930972 RepID=UPI0026668A04|nr:hypothetical protein [Porifericola rhodea]WKN30316.1 hypothetical protein PZB74_15230 [Porifericola rhodea]
MIKSKKGIAQILEDARLLIQGALHQPLVLQEVAKYRYSEKDIRNAQKLLDRAVALQSDKTSKYGKQLGASDQYKKDQAEAWDLYSYHYQLAKLACRNESGLQKRLQLEVPRKRNMAAWMEQSRYFYTELLQLPQVYEAMAVSAEELAQAQAMQEAVADSRRNFKSSQGEAQLATQARNIAFKELEEWTRRFRKVARLALEENDQLLEGMGITVRSKV